jgi:hypothetical protein
LWAHDEARTTFRPFVQRISEHLNGFGEQCMCTTARVIAKPQPEVRSKAEPPEKYPRVATWEDREQAEAERRGFKVWIQSQDWGKP